MQLFNPHNNFDLEKTKKDLDIIENIIKKDLDESAFISDKLEELNKSNEEIIIDEVKKKDLQITPIKQEFRKKHLNIL